MKKKNIIIYTAAVLLWFCPMACKKNLDQKIYGSVNDGNFWTSYADLEETLNESRSQLDATWAYYTMFFLLMQDATTDYWVGGANTAGEFNTFGSWKTNFPDPLSWGLWPQLWNSIYYANLALDHVNTVPGLTAAQKNAVTGEAKFERAMNYYFAQDVFGGVAIVTSSNDTRTAIPQTTRDSVRMLVESDLKDAAALLPDKNNVSPTEYTKPSKQAAWGFLARLYLNWEDRSDHWQKASDYSDSVINSNLFTLVTPYSRIFDLNNKNNNEMVYSIHHDATTPNAMGVSLIDVFVWRPGDYKLPANLYAWGDWSVTMAFYNSFLPGDQRRNQLQLNYTTTAGSTSTASQPIMVKYPFDPNTNGYASSNDQPIIRYADIILMKAEAQNQLSNTAAAVSLVNQVRERAGAPDLASSITQSSFSDSLYNERRWEFFYEGLARTDAIRLGKFLPWVAQKTGQPIDTKYLLYPFPGIALTQNQALKQNPGYTN